MLDTSEPRSDGDFFVNKPNPQQNFLQNVKTFSFNSKKKLLNEIVYRKKILFIVFGSKQLNYLL